MHNNVNQIEKLSNPCEIEDSTENHDERIRILFLAVEEYDQ